MKTTIGKPFNVLALKPQAPYVECPICTHTFVPRPPQTYTDVGQINRRMKEIVKPKLEWMLEVYGLRKPSLVFDIGAGGGHFVHAVRSLDIDCHGWETNEDLRRFAFNEFEITLHDIFIPTKSASIITMWGLLEYLPDPITMLKDARRNLQPDGLLIVEVPRSYSISTIVQSIPDAYIARHNDPCTHVNVFSDRSLLKALKETGFEPVAEWLFGMDAYELLYQVGYRAGDPDLLTKCAGMIAPLQKAFDQARLCDDIVIAARPESQ